jgi:two-component system cell cycle response regulator DivK
MEIIHVRYRTDSEALQSAFLTDDNTVQAEKSGPTSAIGIDMSQTRVLIVDDNHAFIEMTKFVLTAAGNLVDAASDAKSALSKIPLFLPDVILMDIQMPVVDGIELTKRLKADQATRKIPVIAFTAHAARGDEHDLKAAGFDGYIGKPVNVMTLAAEVAFWLEGPETARRSHIVWP